MSGSRTFEIKIVGSTSDLTRAVDAAANATDAATKKISAGARQAGQGLSLLGAGGQVAEGVLSSLQVNLGGVTSGLSALGVGGRAAGLVLGTLAAAATGVALAGDKMTQSLAKLGAATGSAAAARAVYEDLYQLSLRTGVGINDAADAFVRFSVAARAIGATNGQVVELIGTLQQAAAVSGASTQEASAAALQLAQGLASGVLQGDELKSVLEQMPTLAEALAREMGMTVGELRKAGSEGKLTADRVFPALLRAGQDIRREFEALPPTLGRGFATLQTASTRFLADLDQAVGLSRTLASVLEEAGRRLEAARGRVFRTAEQQAQDDLEAAQQRAARTQAEIDAARAQAPAPARRGSLRPGLTGVAQDQAGVSVQERTAELEARLAEEQRLVAAAQNRLFQMAVDHDNRLRGEGETAAARARQAQLTRDAATLQRLREGLEPQLRAQREHNERMEEARGLLARGHIDQARFNQIEADSLKALADADKERAAASRRSAAEAERDADKRGGVVAAMALEERAARREVEALEAGGDARARLAREMEVERRIREAGIPAVEQRTAAEQQAAEAIERSVRATQALRGQIDSHDNAATAARQEAERALQEVSRTAQRISDDVAEAIFDGMTGQGRQQSVLDSFKNLFKRIAVEALSAQVFMPITAGVVGAVPGLFGISGQPAAGGAGAAGGGGIGDLLGLSRLMPEGGINAAMATRFPSLFGGAPAEAFGPFSATNPTQAFQGVTGGATFTGSLAAAGGGFLLGSTLGGFVAGDSPARQTNAKIGAGVGTAAGMAAFALLPSLGPVGLLGAALLGGAGGGLLGGLIGPGKGYEGGDAWTQLDAGGLLRVDGTAGKGFDTGPLLQQLTAETKATNDALRALGLRFDGAGFSTNGQQFGFASIGGGESTAPRSLAEALTQTGAFRTLTSDNRNVMQAARSADSFEAAIKAAEWVQSVYDPMLRSADAGNAFGNAIADLRKPFDEAIATAQKYGLATDALVEAQNRAHGAAVRANFRQVQDNDLSLVMREAQATGSRANVLREQRFAQNIAAQRERDDLAEQLAVRGVTGQQAADVRARLERALSQEAEALARQFAQLARDQRMAAESLTSRITRANAARGGHAGDLQQADLYDFDARSRVEVDSLRDSLRELGLTSSVVEAEVTRLTQAHKLERQAIIEAYAERRRQVAKSLEDRLFAAGNDTSTMAGALAAFDRAALAERTEAAKQGLADLVELERVHAAERGKIIEDFGKRTEAALLGAGGSIRAFLNGLRAGPDAGASPQDRLAAAQGQFGQDLALARGGDTEALARITGTASTLLAAAKDNFASGSEYQVMKRLVESSLASLPATRSYDEQILAELKRLGGAVDVSVDLAVIRTITETLNLLPDAERDRLIQAQTVLRSVEERLGRLLTAAEVDRLVEGELVLRDVRQRMAQDLTASQRAGLVQGAEVLRSIEQRIGRPLSAAEAASLVAGGEVARTIAQQLGRDLTATERAGLVASAQVLRSIEQQLGADLSAAERAGLVQAALVERTVTQALGRDLTAAERAGLVQGASVIRSVEQKLGRLLTVNERSSILMPGDITRRVDQALRRNLTPAERAALVEAGIITRQVDQNIETTETIQISRSIDEKIGAQLFVHAALLSEIVRGTYAVAHNTAGLLNRAGGTGMTQYTDPNKAQLYFRFRANANAILQSVFKDTPGDGLFGFDDLIAGSGQLFATGAAFANGVVRRPTAFTMPGGGLGVMGEAGPEAVMPLVPMPDGSLGVQAIIPPMVRMPETNPMDGAVAELRALRVEAAAMKRELGELRRGQAGQTAVIAEAGNREIAGARQLLEIARETAAAQRLATARPAA